MAENDRKPTRFIGKPAETTGPWLAHAMARWSPGGFKSVTMTIPDDAGPAQVEEFCDRLTTLLKLRSNEMDIEQAETFIRIVAKYEPLDPVALASAVLAHPGLLDMIPELKDATVYSAPAAALMLATALFDAAAAPELEDLCRRVRRSSPLGKGTKQTPGAVRDLIEAFTAPKTPHGQTNHTSLRGLTWDSLPATDA